MDSEETVSKGNRHIGLKYILIAVICLIIIVVAGIYLYKYVTERGPAYFAQNYQKGLQSLRQGSLDDAVVGFEKAAKAKPESADALFGLGVAKTRKGELEEAIGFFEKAIKIAPERVDIRYSAAVAYQRTGRLERALEEYRVIAKQNPDSFQVLNNVGVIQMKLGDNDKALLAIKRAIELNPGYFPAYFNLAKVYEGLGKIDLAAKQYQYVIDKAPKSGTPDSANFARVAEKQLAALKGSKGNRK